MKLGLYSLFDELSGVYLAPFVARGHVEAVRQIRAVFEDPSMAKAAIVTNPGDFSLRRIASFDDETGVVELDRADVGRISALRSRWSSPASDVEAV